MTRWKDPALQIGVAAVAGIVFGLVVGDWASNLTVVGDLFLRLIQMSIVPLVMTSVIVATGGMTGAGTGRLAGRTFSWMIGFSVVAALLAWGLASVIRPGAGMVFSGELDPALAESASQETTWQDTVLGVVSTNAFDAMSTASMLPIIVFSLLFGAALHTYIGATGNRTVLVAILLAHREDELDRDVYAGTKRVAPISTDLDEHADRFAMADRAD